MSSLRARVQNGRLILDEPTNLPDGTEIELAVADPGDELAEAARANLHASLERGLEDTKTGRVIDAAALIDELQRKR